VPGVQLLALRLRAAPARKVEVVVECRVGLGPPGFYRVSVAEGACGADTAPPLALPVFPSASVIETALTLRAEDDSERHNSAGNRRHR
jgi:hypothetical protein